MIIEWHCLRPNSPAADFRSNVMAANGVVSDAGVNNTKWSQK